MARTVLSQKLSPPKLIVPKSEVKKKLEELLENGIQIQNTQFNTEQDIKTTEDKKEQWAEYIAEYLLRAFDNETYSKEFRESYGGAVIIGDIEDSIYNFNNDIRAKINSLQSIIRRLELIPENITFNSQREVPEEIISKEIFIVHGHDDEIKETIAGYIRSIGLSPIILHEQANGGRTIIEKLEHYAEGVGFAIVLVTPDDMGYEKNNDSSSIKPRARQNVIMELGYFVGKLKRKKVCVLYKEGTELPSDLLGVLYVPYDSNFEWKLKIAKELKEAGVKFNFEAAFS